MHLVTWEARRFEKVLGGGRTKPLLLDCECRQGSRTARARLVVKALGLPEVQDFGLCNELYGATLAQWCGVRVPAPALVWIPEEFIAVNLTALEVAGIRLRPGMAVGSHYLPGLTPMNRHPVLRDEDRAAAASIYALDMAIQNPDRRGANPNCGFEGDELVAYDFESAFSFRLGILNPRPWSVSRFAFRGEHVFYPALRAAANVSWGAFLSKFKKTEPQKLIQLCGTIPENWRPHAAPIVEHWSSLLEHADDFAGELERSVL